MEDNKKIERCRYAFPSMRLKAEEWSCHVDGMADDKAKVVTEEICEACERFKSRYIEYPLTIQGIENTFSKDSKWSLHECGKLVKIAPCGEEYGSKTYLKMAGFVIAPIWIFWSSLWKDTVAPIGRSPSRMPQDARGGA